jgi:hypothetical protein
MNEAVESAYFHWLCSKVIDVRNTDPHLTYWKLFRVLHGTEFTWVHHMDENRAADGKDLRRDFITMTEVVRGDDSWRHEMPCSVLEMLIAFAKRAEHMTDIPYQMWFWEFLKNLGLDDMSDAVDAEPQDIVESLTVFLNREYDPDGIGGLFPMDDPPTDQREVEIWYQFCQYLDDHDRLP